MTIHRKDSGLAAEIKDFWVKTAGTVKNPTAVYAKQNGAVTKVWPVSNVLEDWTNGVTNYSTQDGSFSTSTAYNWDGNPVLERTTATISEDYLWPEIGSPLVSGAFEPGDILMVPIMSNDTAAVYFGDPDDSPSNQYEIIVQLGDTGLKTQKDVSGTVTELANETNIGEFPTEGEWSVLFIEWDPPAGDPEDSDGSGTGDFLITVTDGDFIPKAQYYVDAADTSYRSGQVTMSVGSNFSAWYGTIEKVSRGDDRYPRNRTREAQEMDFFENGDFSAWTGREKFTIDGEPNITPSQGDYCLRNVDPTSFSRLRTNTTENLPNHFVDGKTLEIDLQGTEGYTMVEVGDPNGNYVRAEHHWANGEIEVQEGDSLSANVLREDTTFSFPAGWLRLQWDRPTTDKMDFRWYNEAGTLLQEFNISGLSELADSDSFSILTDGSSTATAYHYIDQARVF